MTPAELRQRRQALGFTQQQLADALDLPRATVARWEQGVFAIQHQTMLALALETLERRAERLRT